MTLQPMDGVHWVAWRVPNTPIDNSFTPVGSALHGYGQGCAATTRQRQAHGKFKLFECKERQRACTAMLQTFDDAGIALILAVLKAGPLLGTQYPRVQRATAHARCNLR